MLVNAKKDDFEREDEEAERLVREAPKKKPPRRDRRREHMESDQDPDTDGDPDLKGKDRSLNYKIIGGSVVQNVLRRYAADKIPAKSKETGETVFINPETLKKEPGKYEEIKEEETKKAPEEEKGAPEEPSLEDAVKKTPGLEDAIKADPDAPASTLFPGVKLPEGVNTLADVGRALAEAETAKKEDPPKKTKKKDTEPEDEGPQEEEEPKEPSLSKEKGIGEPKRRTVSSAERSEAIYALSETFPPEIAAKLISQRIHPDDAKMMINAYNASKSREVRDLSGYAAKVSSFYETDPDKVQPPAKWPNSQGVKVAFEDLSPEEKADAYRQHQMQVVAMSLAAKEILKDRLSFKGKIPEQLAASMASKMLKPGGNEEGSLKLAEQVFDSTVESGEHASISDRMVKKLLATVGGNPEAKAIAKSYFEANDYLQAKAKFLGKDGFSEDSFPSVIASGLLDAKKFFAKRAEVYGDKENPASKHFEVQVMTKLKELDPKKHGQVRNLLSRVSARDYEKAKKAYEKRLEAWQKHRTGSPPEPPVEPFSYSGAKDSKALKKEGQGLWDDMLSRAGTSKTASKIAYRHLISSYLKGYSMAHETASQTKEALYHGIDPAENYPTAPYRGWQQAHQRDLGESDYEIIIDSAKEWMSSPVLASGFEGVPDQQYRHALDLAIQSSPYSRAIDVQTYNVLLSRLQGVPEPGLDQSGVLTKMAAGNRVQLEKKVYAKFPPDSKSKHGSRLKVMLTGKTAEVLRKSSYSLVFLDELSDKELETLADTVKVKTAGYSYATETASFILYGKGPFNRDVTNDINTYSMQFRDDEGEVHDDAAMKIVNHKSGPIATRGDEMQGMTQEVLVTLQFPKGAQEETFKALQAVAGLHKLKAEKARPGQKPGLRKSEPVKRQSKSGLRGLRATIDAGDTTSPSIASLVKTTSESTNGERQMLRLSNEQKGKADQLLGRLDKVADVIQKNASKWGIPFDEAKKIVNTLDKVADDAEAVIYGEDSLHTRQAEVLLNDADFTKAAKANLGEETFTKAAKVIQRDSDEPYMDTFINPMKPIQTDADEPYMSAYGDDQSSAVETGEDATGRDLAPGA